MNLDVGYGEIPFRLATKLFVEVLKHNGFHVGVLSHSYDRDEIKTDTHLIFITDNKISLAGGVYVTMEGMTHDNWACDVYNPESNLTKIFQEVMRAMFRIDNKRTPSRTKIGTLRNRRRRR